jgi:hypothetical protein
MVRLSGIAAYHCQQAAEKRNLNAILNAACHAWNAILEAPSRIMSIGLRQWAHIGQL